VKEENSVTNNMINMNLLIFFCRLTNRLPKYRVAAFNIFNVHSAGPFQRERLVRARFADMFLLKIFLRANAIK
jgi:hypothetical protein